MKFSGLTEMRGLMKTQNSIGRIKMKIIFHSGAVLKKLLKRNNFTKFIVCLIGCVDYFEKS